MIEPKFKIGDRVVVLDGTKIEQKPEMWSFGSTEEKFIGEHGRVCSVTIFPAHVVYTCDCVMPMDEAYLMLESEWEGAQKKPKVIQWVREPGCKPWLIVFNKEEGVTVVKTPNGKEGKAKLSPNDTWDAEKGLAVATAKLLFKANLIGKYGDFAESVLKVLEESEG